MRANHAPTEQTWNSPLRLDPSVFFHISLALVACRSSSFNVCFAFFLLYTQTARISGASMCKSAAAHGNTRHMKWF